MAATAATSPTSGSSCTHAESVPPPAAAPDSPGRVTRLINAVGGLIGGGALSPSRAAPADEIGASPFNEEVTLIRPYRAREITSSNLTKRMTVTLRDRQRKIMLKTGRMIGERYTTTIKF